MSDASRIIRLRNGYHVWTRRIEARPQPPERPTPPGTSPAWCPRVLLLHGGPGFSHEYLENFEQHLPPAGVELYFYDQLGSYFSDQPDDPSLWTVDRFAQEVEAVREALGLEDFFLVGQSWGGMLAMEYVLRYQSDGQEGPVRGLVISNMTASIASYMKSVQRLRQQLPAETLAILERYEQAGA
ncbi:MAG: proline iminopeptidase-family hydrolase, partial [Firmicutes bacterium]|nr:proline iminopeptidase-family hydrolase [Bacillota bacterium]